MFKAFTKKNKIISILILMYIIALPLILYFSSAFKQTEPPDLKRLTGYMPEYNIKQDYDINEIYSVTGLDVEHFNESGYIQSDIRVFTQSNEHDKISYIILGFTFEEIHYIKVTIYMPEVPVYAFNFESILFYKRIEIHNKAIGIYEDTLLNRYTARYHDGTGCVYYIEPLLGFNDIENDFISLLVLMLK